MIFDLTKQLQLHFELQFLDCLLYLAFYSSTDPDGVCNALCQSSLGVPAEDLVLVAVIHLPFTQAGAGQRVQAAGSANPQHTVELEQKTTTVLKILQLKLQPRLQKTE